MDTIFRSIVHIVFLVGENHFETRLRLYVCICR